MAVEYCSENSALVMSPRISFSYDLSLSDIAPDEQTRTRSNSKTGVDFDFGLDHSFENESSSAEELFSDGKIIPTHVKKSITIQKQNSLPEPSQSSPKPPEFEIEQNGKSKDLKEKHNTKSFWGFKRSNSCGSGYGPSLCPLPLLSRSHSTGSSNSSKKSSISKENQNIQKQNLLKGSSNVPSRSSSLKPPLKKSYGSYGNGVNPVLHVHSGNLFGLGSIFSSGKDKNKKK